MKLFQIALIIFMLLLNLVRISPAWADEESQLSKNHNHFVGERVVWLYKARSDSDHIQRIPAEVIKLGSKQVQVRVRTQDNKLVNRWVNTDKLE
ncbi:hypothetical protein QUB80_25155 [Chlorogloeopsis sp. ULAP01]|uniref:hypothetical protein n=1 Tax=Chlorogloeopsis sp. ULAP01 TaxID=3056483 RepID=UPI0025AAED36|nr:hypothetical protein [Chlorogloeopsis sp. ULAP01]MDM9383972.1 hypothetical protein [Chlorogloeopsis sp. ULAP01]